MDQELRRRDGGTRQAPLAFLAYWIEVQGGMRPGVECDDYTRIWTVSHTTNAETFARATRVAREAAVAYVDALHDLPELPWIEMTCRWVEP